MVRVSVNSNLFRVVSNLFTIGYLRVGFAFCSVGLGCISGLCVVGVKLVERPIKLSTK